MLSNSHNNKLLLLNISSTSTHESWPQNQIIPLNDLMASSSSSSQATNTTTNTNNKVSMEQLKPSPADLQPLKCPRCDSANTKFCYYNNYSLSQPRHFCKACKRYWTRGGTLRNVPVGGGCRKNKRVKRPSQQNLNGVEGASTNPSIQSRAAHVDLSSSHENNNNPNNNMFYNNEQQLNFPFSSFRVSSADHQNINVGFDINQHHHMSNNNGLGLGFSTSSSSVLVPHFSQSGGINNSYSSMLFGGSNFGTSSEMASLLASGFQHHHHQKFNTGTTSSYQGLLDPNNNNYSEDHQGTKNDHDQVIKREGDHYQWNPNLNPNINDQMGMINGSSATTTDPSTAASLVWNNNNNTTNNNLGPWFHDPSSSNMGSSSVPSLI